jgi:AbrB family looped-hinge helix DNA binding protein
MATIAKISSKGQIVIPVAIRKKLGSPKAMIIEEDDGKVILVPTLTFEEAFGIDGRVGAKIASEISRDRRREVESERA